jgi:hypothetical protein
VSRFPQASKDKLIRSKNLRMTFGLGGQSTRHSQATTSTEWNGRAESAIGRAPALTGAKAI